MIKTKFSASSVVVPSNFMMHLVNDAQSLNATYPIIDCVA